MNYDNTIDGKRPVLVGEMNPYQKPGADPTHRFDLYPKPERASGGRLCYDILGMSAQAYLRAFVRRDLLTGDKWSVPKAREAAATLWRDSGEAPLILLGAKVTVAFGLSYKPFVIATATGMNDVSKRVVILPHPSGLCRVWSEDPKNYQRARDLVNELLTKDTDGTCKLCRGDADVPVCDDSAQATDERVHITTRGRA